MKRFSRVFVCVCVVVVAGCVKQGTEPNNLCTAEYAPVCALVQVQCIKAPCDPINQTFSNACVAEKAGATILYQGECRDTLKADGSKKLLPKGTFHKDDTGKYVGDLYVKGYTEVRAIPEAFCEGDDCEIQQVVFFIILESSNDALSTFVIESEGNAFISKESIAMGCVEEGKIVYNQRVVGDEGIDRTTTTLSLEQSEMLLGADTQEKNIVVHLTKKPPVEGGTEAPNCYTHFEEVIVNPHLPVEGKVSRTGTAANQVTVTSPGLNEDVSSPLSIEGSAPGYWFFEGSAPVHIVNRDGLIIGEGYITAEGDWMTEDIIPFQGSLEFTLLPFMPSRTGWLILRKDNPSGLPENDAAVEIPVMF